MANSDRQSAGSIAMTKHDGNKHKTIFTTNAIVPAWHILLTSNERLVTNLRRQHIAIVVRRC